VSMISNAHGLRGKCVKIQEAKYNKKWNNIIGDGKYLKNRHDIERSNWLN